MKLRLIFLKLFKVGNFNVNLDQKSEEIYTQYQKPNFKF